MESIFSGEHLFFGEHFDGEHFDGEHFFGGAFFLGAFFVSILREAFGGDLQIMYRS